MTMHLVLEMEWTVEMVGLEATVETVGTADTHQRAMKEEMGVDRQLTVGMVVLEVFQGILEDRQEVEMEATSSEAGILIKKTRNRGEISTFESNSILLLTDENKNGIDG